MHQRPLAYDPQEALATLQAADRVLAELITRAGPFRLQTRAHLSPFQALLRAIVYQQLSGQAAETIYQRLLGLFPQRRPTPQRLLSASAEALRGAGLSRAKIAAAQDLAAKALDGTVPSRQRLQTLDDEAVIERLLAVRGVGRWTAEMLLMFYLGRPDVLPVADLGVRKGFMLTYRLAQLPGARELLAHGESWRPYRSVASWYLWRALDLTKLP
jgi:DNA-3-methyladenine glycosylase II